jgi:predicted ATPase
LWITQTNRLEIRDNFVELKPPSMELKAFQIKKFKSINDSGKCFLSSTGNLTILAGQNEAGKSAIIEALDFFGNGPSKNFNLQKRQEENPEVTCWFKLDDSQLATIREHLTGLDRIRELEEALDSIALRRGNIETGSHNNIEIVEANKLKDFFDHTDLIAQNEEIVQNLTAKKAELQKAMESTQSDSKANSDSLTATNQKIDDVNAEISKLNQDLATAPDETRQNEISTAIQAHQKIVVDSENLIKEINQKALVIDGTLKTFEVQIQEIENNLSETSLTLDELKKGFTYETLEKIILGGLRRVILYDSFNDLLPGLIEIGEIPKNPAVLDFQTAFNVDFKAIAEKPEQSIKRAESKITSEASDDLNTYWTQKLEKESEYTFSVKIQKNKEDVNKSTVEFYVERGDNDPLQFIQKSTGFRWFSSFNLRLKSLGIKENDIQNLIILIDEPGQGLHEIAQQDVKRVIEELGNKGAQIIYTTHHPNLIGTNGVEFNRIRLVSNSKKNGTKVQTVSQYAASKNNGAKDALSPVIAAMGISSIGPLISKNKHSVVVEGITDHYYFTAFQKLHGISEKIQFIPATGVDQVPNIYSILVGWGLSCLAVMDDDTQGRNVFKKIKAAFYENDDILSNEHLMKLKNCNGIEDMFSPEDFKKFVLQSSETDTRGQKNSELVTDKKELHARLFLETVESGSLTRDNLTETTNKNFKDTLDWMLEKFGLQSIIE